MIFTSLRIRMPTQFWGKYSSHHSVYIFLQQIYNSVFFFHKFYFILVQICFKKCIYCHKVHCFVGFWLIEVMETLTVCFYCQFGEHYLIFEFIMKSNNFPLHFFRNWKHLLSSFFVTASRYSLLNTEPWPLLNELPASSPYLILFSTDIFSLPRGTM